MTTPTTPGGEYAELVRELRPGVMCSACDILYPKRCMACRCLSAIEALRGRIYWLEHLPAQIVSLVDERDSLREQLRAATASAMACGARNFQLEEQLAAARADAEAGWSAFYKLRGAVAKDRYPELTGIVRATDAAIDKARGEAG